MNEIQAAKLSTFVVEENLGHNLKIYDDVQFWDVDNENSNCDFKFSFIRYTDGHVEMAVNMKHLFNKPKDSPIIVRFPETKEEWQDRKSVV